MRYEFKALFLLGGEGDFSYIRVVGGGKEASSREKATHLKSESYIYSSQT